MEVGNFVKAATFKSFLHLSYKRTLFRTMLVFYAMLARELYYAILAQTMQR